MPLLPIYETTLQMTNQPPYVLLADDDPDDLEFFCSAMRRLFPGVDVIAFGDGDLLLDYLSHCNPAAFPVCILVDYKMPRLAAPQFLQATGGGTPYDQIPKFVWSTSHRKKDMDDCINHGARSFLIKPTTESQLEQAILSLIAHTLLIQRV